MTQKIRITYQFDIDVVDLGHFGATTLLEAAENLQKWLDNGDMSITDIICRDKGGRMRCDRRSLLGQRGPSNYRRTGSVITVEGIED